MTLLQGLALSLGLDRECFSSQHVFHEPSGDVLRFLYYPPLPDGHGDTRAGAHSDYGSCTLLFTEPSDPGGLQIWSDADNAFVPVIPPRPGLAVFNLGDLLEYWTGNVLRSTIHRVVAPAGPDRALPRYSIAYFCHANDDALLQPIPGLQEASGRERPAASCFETKSIAKLRDGSQPRTAKEHLLARLETTRQVAPK
ncbi:hypothetical protein HDU91_000383 [Kappamyces sp. JEL0680]|nr:hypothetical protein HDU91_000383 [Kappamyces sp. JEL0680]